MLQINALIIISYSYKSYILIFFRWIDTLPDGPDEPPQSKLKNRNSTVSFFFLELFVVFIKNILRFPLAIN